MKIHSRFLIPLILCALSAACVSPATTQSITVSRNGNSLVISGQGFSNIPQCARLSLIGLPPPEAAVAIGPAQCSGGSFQNFTWPFAYGAKDSTQGPCYTTTTQSVVVSAIDQAPPNGVATAQIAIPWGSNCTMLCGTLGQPACPSGCLEGVNSKGPGGVNGTCVACGGEGQPPCANQACEPGLYPTLNTSGSGPQTICTASCGGVNQPACITYDTQYNYLCHDGATMNPQSQGPGDCMCVYDPNSNPCQLVTSGTSGFCLAQQKSPPGCK